MMTTVGRPGLPSEARLARGR